MVSESVLDERIIEEEPKIFRFALLTFYFFHETHACFLFEIQAQSIISNHIEHRRHERLQDPDRFNRKPTLGELAVRQPQVISVDDEGYDSPNTKVRVRPPQKQSTGKSSLTLRYGQDC